MLKGNQNIGTFDYRVEDVPHEVAKENTICEKKKIETELNMNEEPREPVPEKDMVKSN